MRNFVDITGLRFGRLTAICRDGTGRDGNALWKFKCDCGNDIVAASNIVRRGDKSSCGCLRAPHGGARDRLYGVWCSMKRRCDTPSCAGYKNYGGRGIKVCAEWRDDYRAFKDWAFAHGYDENSKKGECTLDRIDVNGDYCPENCRWITMKEQSNNKRNNHCFEYQGKTYTASELADMAGLEYHTFLKRMEYGWDIETAMSVPSLRRESFDERRQTTTY